MASMLSAIRWQLVLPFFQQELGTFPCMDTQRRRVFHMLDTNALACMGVFAGGCIFRVLWVSSRRFTYSPTPFLALRSRLRRGSERSSGGGWGVVASEGGRTG